MKQGNITFRVDRFSDRKGGHPNRPATQTILGTIIGDSSMKKIDVSTPKYPNTYALVSDEDYDGLSKHKWHAAKGRNTLYAHRGIQVSDGNWRRIQMHRIILGLKAGVLCDHRDGNGLNNQRGNIRPCTITENNRNSRLRKNNTSGYKGVNRVNEAKTWQASISVDNVTVYLGTFSIAENAAKAYDEAARKYHKEFAKTNFACRNPNPCIIQKG